jgi:TrmH family RNA methyltransferase
MATSIPMDHVTSPANPTLRLVRSLYAKRSTRRREGLFVAEGLRTLSTLLGHGCLLRYLLIDDDARDAVPSDFVDAARQADAHILAIEADLFRDISDVETPQPVIGVFAIPEPKMPAKPSVVVALDGVQDPGNIGSILRTCRAANVEAVLLSKGVVDPYSPKVVRATAGQLASLPILDRAGPDSLHSAPDRIVVADSRRGEAYSAFDWTLPFVLVLGSEASGPGPDWQSAATDFVHISMNPEVESLNVAAAAAVLLFEAQRQIQAG